MAEALSNLLLAPVLSGSGHPSSDLLLQTGDFLLLEDGTSTLLLEP